MKKIKNSTIIAIAIMNLNKKEIGVEDLLDYAKKISIYFKDKGYNVSKIDKTNISNFFKMFPYIGNVKNGNLKPKIYTKVCFFKAEHGRLLVKK